LRHSTLVRLGLGAATAAVLLVVLAPSEPQARIGLLAALAAGMIAGLVLYLAVARRRPYVPPPAPSALLACVLLVVAAARPDVSCWASCSVQVRWRPSPGALSDSRSCTGLARACTSARVRHSQACTSPRACSRRRSLRTGPTTSCTWRWRSADHGGRARRERGRARRRHRAARRHRRPRPPPALSPP